MSQRYKKSEVRGGRKEFVLGTVIGWFLRLLGMTLRYQIQDEAGILKKKGENYVFIIWHNRIVGMPYVKRRYMQGIPSVVLTSASRDGAFLARAVKVCGNFDSVRGSSSRRGLTALREMKKVVAEGKSVIFSPDGPRGPVYELQPGFAYLAQAEELDVVVANVHYTKYWQLSSWDKMQIPKPFSKVELEFLPPCSFVRECHDMETILDFYKKQMFVE